MIVPVNIVSTWEKHDFFTLEIKQQTMKLSWKRMGEVCESQVLPLLLYFIHFVFSSIKNKKKI